MSLASRLVALDGKGYGAYKSLRGEHAVAPGVTLHLDKVQADPFAPPSLLRVVLERAVLGNIHDLAVRHPGAAGDHLTRRLVGAIAELSPHGKENGHLAIDRPGQQVLVRSTVVFTRHGLELRMEAALPAKGRRIRGRVAARLLTEVLPDVVTRAVVDADPEKLQEAIRLKVDQEDLREQVRADDLVAFVADGSVLPRRSGDSDEPLRTAVTFQSPESLRRSYRLPSGREVTGMGLARGVTVIVGGGFHGKSTLLRALQSGVYDHVAGDGRELIVSVDDAVALRAEDGRAVTGVDISQFIDGLPTGAGTTNFSTPNASGSTSQAAWLSEALEAGSSCLLIDEDTSATNFMIRDERMRLLVPADREPITPLINRIRGLWEGAGVSTVLVTGGSGAYLDVADRVILMDDYLPLDVTERAAKLREPVPAQEPYPLPAPRRPCIDVRGKRPPQAKGLQVIRVGDGQLDLSALAQLVDGSQTRTIATLLPRVQQRLEDGASLADAADAALHENVVTRPGRHPGRLAQVRPQELMFAVNHLRP